MYKRLINLLLSVSLVGFSLAQTPIETAETIIETDETQPEIVETIPIIPSKSYSHDEVMEAIENEVRYTKHWDENCYDDTIQLSQEDALLLMRIASAEALNQGTTGMIKVMNVVINRVNSDDFPDTIWEVYSQHNDNHYQFESYQNGSWKTACITPEVHLALAELEKNKNLDPEIVGFGRVDVEDILSQWFDVAYTVEDHTFYTLKKD